jgi:hypothetical protein
MGSHLVLPWTAETIGKRRAAATGFPRALTAAWALGGGAPMSGKASTGAAGLGEPPRAVDLAWGGSRTMRRWWGKEARVSSLAAKIRSKTSALYKVVCSEISHTSRTLSPCHLIRSGVRFHWDSSVGENLPFLLIPVRFFCTDPMCKKGNSARWWLRCGATGARDRARAGPTVTGSRWVRQWQLGVWSSAAGELRWLWASQGKLGRAQGGQGRPG